MDQTIKQLPGRLVLLAFAGIVVTGGSNFVAVKFSNAELPPLYGAGLRFGMAALILLAIMRVRRMPLPRGRALAGAALYGSLSFGTVYGLIYFAVSGIGAGTTSVVLASVPLATLLIAVFFGQERFTVRGMAGGLLAVGGIAVLSSGTLQGATALLPLLAAVGAVIGASLGAVLVKGFPKSDPITTNAVGMSVGATGLLLASAAMGEAWFLPGRPATWMALGWLVALGSVSMFALFVFVIKNWTASATAYALTLMPVVAVGLGALLAGEAVTGATIGGGLLVVLGVYVGALSGLGRKAIPQPGPRVAEERAVA